MWQNPEFPAGLVTFIKEILNGKLHLWSVMELFCDNSELLSAVNYFHKKASSLLQNIE